MPWGNAGDFYLPMYKAAEELKDREVRFHHSCLDTHEHLHRGLFSAFCFVYILIKGLRVTMNRYTLFKVSFQHCLSHDKTFIIVLSPFCQLHDLLRLVTIHPGVRTMTPRDGDLRPDSLMPSPGHISTPRDALSSSIRLVSQLVCLVSI